MPISSDILTEIGTWAKDQQITQAKALDAVRKKYLVMLSDIMKMPVICYFANFKHPLNNIDLSDIHSFMGMLKDLNGNDLCLFIHSPGGSFDATDELVQYLHSKFKNIEAVVPLHAFSCATLLTCACSKIYMGKQSCLGPIDPQMRFVNVNNQVSYTAAQDILDQFEAAKIECAKNPQNIFAWQPILQQYAPAFLRQCEVAKERSRELARSWLRTYQGLKASEARELSNWLVDRKRHNSHGRPLCFSDLKSKKMNVLPLEDNQNLQDAALSLLHAYMFSIGSHAKIIENSIGRIQVVA